MNITNIHQWLHENENQFVPPVCNKMLHNEQLKVMFVGGPNQREDYHIEEGEEGDMCLKTIEKGQRRDVFIREGECFLLPAGIFHSPQRESNTIGLVIERTRLSHERDGLRYHIKDTTTPLFERWFHCMNLGTQLVPIINEFFDSEECVTQVPTEYSVPAESVKCPINTTLSTDEPIKVDQFLEQHKSQIQTCPKRMYTDESKTDVFWYGQGTFEIYNRDHETFLWQWRSDGTVTSEQETKPFTVNNSILVPANVRLTLTNINSDSTTLSVAMPYPK